MNKKTKNTLGIIFTIIVIALLNYKTIATLFKDILSQNGLNQYSGQIDSCLKSKESSVGERKVLGLEYACAIEVAATIYEKEPDKAIDLCKKYSPFPALSADPSSERIQISACKSSIEKHLK